MRKILYILAVLLIAAPGWADGARDDSHGRGHEDDHDRARHALERGEILSLADILKKSEQKYAGQLIEAELEDEHGKWFTSLSF